MNKITWHESVIWFFIAQKLLFANQYVRKFQIFIKFLNFQKFHKISKKFKMIKVSKIIVK